VLLVTRYRHPSIGGELEQRLHLIDLGPLRPVDVTREANELLALRARRHEGRQLQRLLVVDDHVSQEEQILLRVRRVRAAGRLGRDAEDARQ
jgi:hypothetical protein